VFLEGIWWVSRRREVAPLMGQIFFESRVRNSFGGYLIGIRFFLIRFYIKIYIIPMKLIIFTADTLQSLVQMSAPHRKAIGFQIYLLQKGMKPYKLLPLRFIGSELDQLLVPIGDSLYRVVHYARIEGNIYILNIFSKESMQSKMIEARLTKQRYLEVKKALNEGIHQSH